MTVDGRDDDPGRSFGSLFETAPEGVPLEDVVTTLAAVRSGESA